MIYPVKSLLPKYAAEIHKISAAITPKSNTTAVFQLLRKLVSINKKKTGPIRIVLNKKPISMAEKIISITKLRVAR